MTTQKTLFITGASRGIGKALAKKFLEENYSVIGTSTSGTIPFAHKNLTMLKLDLSSEKSIEKCVSDFLKLNKKIYILINNAGIWGGFEDDIIRIDVLRKVLEVNLFGTINLTEKLIPSMNSSGKIINISSRAGSLSYKGTHHANHPDYNISKAALNMYTISLASKLKNKNILVASIHPGWVKTDMGGKGADITPEQAAEDIYKRIITLKETGQFWFKQEKFPW
ncbi:MAG: SDR family NAD(P)-dependent oxidoreductase [Nanoarchaeota archaeon]